MENSLQFAPESNAAQRLCSSGENIAMSAVEIDERLSDRPISPKANAAAAWPSIRARCGVQSLSEQTVETVHIIIIFKIQGRTKEKTAKVTIAHYNQREITAIGRLRT